MAEPAPLRMTLAEFLEWDDGTDMPYELVNGIPVPLWGDDADRLYRLRLAQGPAMGPADPDHGTILANVAGELRSRLSPPCHVVVPAGIVRDEAAGTYLIADAAVSCTLRSEAARWLTAPVLIAEILSPPTQDRDRGTKLDAYMGIPSVAEILLVHSRERSAMLFRRLDAGWLLQDFFGDTVMRLDSLDIDLPLAEVYRNVAL